MMKKNVLKKGLSVMLSASFAVTSIPCGIQAAASEEAKRPEGISEYRNVYFVDCGDYDVTTVSEGDAFGEYNSVTDRIYGKDSKAGKRWGIVDAPVGGGPVLGGTVYQESSNNGAPTLNRVINAPATNWTWPQADDWDGIWDGDPKEKTTRFTKNQLENGMERRIQYKFELEPGEYQVETYMADPWNCSHSVYVYANKGKTNEVQIAEQGTDVVKRPLNKTVTVGEDNELTMDYGSNDKDNGAAVNVSYIIISKGDEKLYFVDCGDYDVTTVSEGDSLGTYNSVTDQIYGKDSQTGKYWGIVDAPVGGGFVPGGVPYQESSNNGAPTLDRVINAPATNWTWPQSDDWDGISDGDPKEKSTRFTKNQIEKGRERQIQYKFELEPGTYEVETYMADPWNAVSSSAYVYANKGKENEVRIAEQHTDIVGKPLRATVTVGEDNELTMDYGSNDDEHGRAVNVSYIIIARAGTEADRLNLDWHDLSIPGEASDSLELPTAGMHGTQITWSSDNENIITKEGMVTKPVQDTVVTLTATVTLGEVQAEKNFQVTVKAGSLEEVKAAAIRELEAYVLADDYSEEGKAELQIAIQTGTANINAAETKEAVVKALADAKGVIDGIPTNEQELATAKETANAALDTYFAEDIEGKYLENETTAYYALIESAVIAVDEAVSASEVYKIMEDLEAAIADLPTAEELTVTGVAIKEGTEISLEEGNSVKLTADITKGAKAEPTVVWSSDDDAVFVDENGTVTANYIGTATVTAKVLKNPECDMESEDGYVSAAIKITVTAKKYAVTVAENGKIVDAEDENKTTGSYEALTLVKVTASPAPEGKKFAYWMNDKKKIVCYVENYSFYVMENVTLTPVYKDADVAVEEQITILCTAAYSKSTGKLAFTSKRSLPAGYTVVEHGVVITDSTGWEKLGAEGLVLGANRTRKAVASTTGRLGTYVARLTSKDPDIWYGKSYVKYKAPGSDEEKILYSDYCQVTIK